MSAAWVYRQTERYERTLAEDAPNPICGRCEATARAYARYFPEGPEAA